MLASIAGELGREPVVRRHERRQPGIGQLLLGQPHGGVGALVGPLDEGLPLGDPVVGRAVDLDVVVGRVGGAVGQRRRDQAEELVLELVGDGIAHHRQVGLVGVEDVLDQRVVGWSPSRAPCSA